MHDDESALTRRYLLSISGIGLSGLGLASGASLAASSTQASVVRLSLNENPLGPSPLAVAAVQGKLSEICRYAGDEALLLTQAIAARENVATDQIVLGEVLEALGLYLAMNGPSGGEFIYSVPGYTALVDAVAPGGGGVTGVPLNDDLQNDLSAIAARVSARTRAIYLINPHNPSGTVSDGASFIAFVREMSERTTVIVDEAYLEFEPDFLQRSVVGLSRAGQNVIVFRTFTKLYGLAGLPMGYAVAPAELAKSFRRTGVGISGPIDGFAVAAAIGSLRDTQYVPRVRAQVIAERERWNSLLDGMKIRRSDSRGNFVFFETGRPHREVAAALRAKGVDIGRAFPPLDHWARVSIGLPAENAIARDAVADLLH